MNFGDGSSRLPATVVGAEHNPNETANEGQITALLYSLLLAGRANGTLPDTLRYPCEMMENASKFEEENACQPINISRQVPEAFAIPLYGYVMPAIVAITVVTNTFIVIVLSQKHLRTPTNFILMSMAVSELLTGLVSTPWLIYYYTFQGYLVDRKYGLSSFWCSSYMYFSMFLPTIFHTQAVWLTVFLAVQRYLYVCVPSMVHRYCSPRHTKHFIAGICIAAVVAELPRLFGSYAVHYPSEHGQPRFCVLMYSRWVMTLGLRKYYTANYWFRILLVHIIPCAVLLFFTGKLVAAIQRAEVRKRSLHAPQPRQPMTGMQRLRSWREMSRNRNSTRARRRASSINCVAGRRSMNATNRMLCVVIALFLLIEIPIAIIFILHYGIASFGFSQLHYRWMNVVLIFRNVLIILAYPFNFAIYCSMSEQFRLTVKQLFSRNIIFIPQAATNHYGGKRYSLILVDVGRSTSSARSSLRGERAHSVRERVQQQQHQRHVSSHTMTTTASEAAGCYELAAVEVVAAHHSSPLAKTPRARRQFFAHFADEINDDAAARASASPSMARQVEARRNSYRNHTQIPAPLLERARTMSAIRTPRPPTETNPLLPK